MDRNAMTDPTTAPGLVPPRPHGPRDERILEKMESLERIAAGVSHDMNNILSGIVTYPEVLLMRRDLDEKIRKALTLVQESGERASALIGDLTTITRDNRGNWEIFSLNALVQEYLISPEYRKLKLDPAHIAVKTRLGGNVPDIHASRMHVRKALMHLVANAAQSIGSNGEIIVSTAMRRLDRPLQGQWKIPPGLYALLSVTDSGGVPEVHVGHLFEPFYTRNVMGRKGSGLELPLVWHTLRDHSGGIVVTADAASARFDLYFPVARDKAGADPSLR